MSIATDPGYILGHSEIELRQVNATDWAAWHDRYDRQGGVMGQRLALVQAQIRRFLDDRKGEELRVISICRRRS